MERDQGPAERADTLRVQLREVLRSGVSQTVRELSQALGASERDLFDHLEHLARSLERSGERLVIEPARCLGCSFSFDERTRFKKPGRCPACKSTRIAPPRFAVSEAR